MPPRGSPAPSSSSWSAPTPTSSACRSTRPWRFSPARVSRPPWGGRRRRRAVPTASAALPGLAPCARSAAFAFARFGELSEYVDLDGAREHGAPSMQERLQPRVAGKLLAVGLERLVDLVIDDLHELGGLVDILEEPDRPAAEQLVIGFSGPDECNELGRLGGRQGELELKNAPDRLSVVHPRGVLGPAGGRFLHDGTAPMQRFYRNTTAAGRQHRECRRMDNRGGVRGGRGPIDTAGPARPYRHRPREAVAIAASRAYIGV